VEILKIPINTEKRDKTIARATIIRDLSIMYLFLFFTKSEDFFYLSCTWLPIIIMGKYQSIEMILFCDITRGYLYGNQKQKSFKPGREYTERQKGR
jgi:hypothetical protein